MTTETPRSAERTHTRGDLIEAMSWCEDMRRGRWGVEYATEVLEAHEERIRREIAITPAASRAALNAWLARHATREQSYDAAIGKEPYCLTDEQRRDHDERADALVEEAAALIREVLASSTPECACVGYTILTDYGTGIEHDVDRSSCPIHSEDDDA
jgi:tRNA A37 N6-isopentenylltransferase MiaA